MTSLSEGLLLAGAGVVAGTIGAAGGITSLVSYPALLAVGIAPLPANVTNSVAVVGSFVGSSLGSRPELRGEGRWVLRWAPLAIVGGLIGVTLLLSTPYGVFDHLVPYLLTVAALTLLFQPIIARWRAHAKGWFSRLAWPLGLFGVCVYDGYFGAGSGIMVIAVMMVTVHDDLVKANALKNVVLGVADVVAAVAFVLFGPVRLLAAVALGAGLVVGSFIGPSITRRVPSDLWRVTVALVGLGLAVWLWVRPA